MGGAFPPVPEQPGLNSFNMSLIAVAEKAQKHEEEVDEVEVEGKRAENGTAGQNTHTHPKKERKANW